MPAKIDVDAVVHTNSIEADAQVGNPVNVPEVISVNGQSGNVTITLENLGYQNPDWAQDDSEQQDYIKNRPALRAGTGENSIIEGNIGKNIASGKQAHAEGSQTSATGNWSHAEGGGTTASGSESHAEGSDVTASGIDSHAEGYNTSAAEWASHAEGMYTTASKRAAHAEGYGTEAKGLDSHSEGSHTTAEGDYSHAEGSNATASGQVSHAEGDQTSASGSVSHAEGSQTTASGKKSHAEGTGTTASSLASHAEGAQTTASGDSSHAEGGGTTASGTSSHAEGSGTEASGTTSHAEGGASKATGGTSHAEGGSTVASGICAHSEGGSTTASGVTAHAEGGGTVASGDASHAEGGGTIAASDHQHAQGKYNIADDKDVYADIVGNGTDDNHRSNAYTLDWSGNGWYAGKVSAGTAEQPADPVNANDLVTKHYLNQDISSRVTPIAELTPPVSSEIFEVTGIPTYVSDPAEHSEYGLTEPGWYAFVEIKPKDGVTVDAGTLVVEGAAGYIAAASKYIYVAVKFEVAAMTQAVTINWGSYTETIIFKATDLAVRNLDQRVTFYVYDADPFATWEYTPATDATFVGTAKYFTKDGDAYQAAEVTAGDPVPAIYYNANDVYALTTDATFVEGKTYYTKTGDTYTEAAVTAGEAVPADTYYTKTVEYVLTEDTAFQEGKTYYTKSGTTYTAAEVTAGEQLPTVYFVHSKVIISGLVRNVTYRLNQLVDCPMEFVLPEIDDETHGAWFEIRCRHAGAYSMTLTPPEGVKIATEHTQKETAGINMINLHYTVVDGVKIWRFMNTHSSIPA